MEVIFIPPVGNAYWEAPISSIGNFPISDTQYAVRLAEDTGYLYYWTGSAWALVQIGAVLAALSATSPLLYNPVTGVFSIQVANTTDNGYLSAANWNTFNNKEPAISSGTTAQYWRGDKSFQNLNTAIYALLSAVSPLSFNSSSGAFSIPVATSGANGYLSSADWTTFNAKEGPITAGTTAQFWRGDKTFQTLNIPAMSSVISGASPATGALNEVLTASQASNTVTGVGSTGAYGSVVSKDFTAGRWMIFGSCGFNENTAVLTTGLQCGISTSATGVGLDEFDTALSNGLISSTSDLILATPPIFANLSSTTTYYLNSKFYYTSGAPRHRGKITGVRIG